MSTRFRRLWPCAIILALQMHAAWATNTSCNPSTFDAAGGFCARLATADLIPDIVSGGTAISSWTGDADDGYAEVPLPQSFVWYGLSYNSAFVATNGYLSFGSGYTLPGNFITSVPNAAAPNNAVYAYGDDLDPSVGGTVLYRTTPCTVDRDRNGSNDACFIVQWNGIRLYASSVLVTVQLALDFASNEALVEIETESGGGRNSRPRVVGTENADASAGLWFRPGSATTSGSVTAGYQFIFSRNDVTPPRDVTKLTGTSGAPAVDLLWQSPTDFDFAGSLVVAQSPGLVDSVPVRGRRYNVGDAVGTGVAICTTDSITARCADNLMGQSAARGYQVFAYDTLFNYSGGVDLNVNPLSSSSWGYHTRASSLAPPAAIPGQYLTATGNDGLLHRIDESSGSRGGWTPVTLAAAVQSRMMVGDLRPGGPADVTAFLSAQDGYLYRFSLADGTTSPQASRNVAGDAGCTGGSLQAGPVVMLDAFDSNANNKDDVVVIATRCGTTDNRVLLYSHDLTTLLDQYAGGPDGLGISNATPRILYRGDGNNLVYVPVRAAGGESLVLLQVDAVPSFGGQPYAVLTGLGDIDVSPVTFTQNGSQWLVVGNASSEVHLFDGLTRVAGEGSALAERNSIASNDGAVRGVAVSGALSTITGQQESWVVWSTNTQVHGAKVGADGLLDSASSWTVSVSSPSPPLVLTEVYTPGDTLAYLGTGSGTVLELDAKTGAVQNSWPVAAGITVGEPTFDWGDGVSQGLVFGSTSGAVYWLPLP